VKNLGDADILFNNAGIIPRSPAIEHLENEWDATLGIDLTAVFILSQVAGKIMLNKGKGKIINIASVLAFQGGLNVAGYASAKHGVACLIKTLVNDWAGKGINVNALAPGFFVTEFTEIPESFCLPPLSAVRTPIPTSMRSWLPSRNTPPDCGS